MTVELEFRRDELELRDLGVHDDEALFHETVIVVPVRLRVGDTDILGASASPSPARDPSAGPQGASAWIEVMPTDAAWSPQPVIGFLTAVRAAVRSAAAGRPATAYLAGGKPSMHFEPVGTELLSVRLGRAEPAVAPTREYVAAIGHFGEVVRAWLNEAAPQLREHTGWEGWFGGSA